MDYGFRQSGNGGERANPAAAAAQTIVIMTFISRDGLITFAARLLPDL
jgi:hypothetical protein